MILLSIKLKDRTVYFPERITTCKRLLMPSCAFFDDTLADIINLYSTTLFAFLSSDAAKMCFCVVCTLNEEEEEEEEEEEDFIKGTDAS